VSLPPSPVVVRACLLVQFYTSSSAWSWARLAHVEERRVVERWTLRIAIVSSGTATSSAGGAVTGGAAEASVGKCLGIVKCLGK
jgi:hypothetical protein